jgi:hypothetical protein
MEAERPFDLWAHHFSYVGSGETVQDGIRNLSGGVHNAAQASRACFGRRYGSLHIHAFGNISFDHYQFRPRSIEASEPPRLDFIRSAGSH